MSGSWIRASKDGPCPLCGAVDWCSVAPDGGGVICGRTTEAPHGWHRAKDARDGRPIYVRERERRPTGRAHPRSARR